MLANALPSTPRSAYTCKRQGESPLWLRGVHSDFHLSLRHRQVHCAQASVAFKGDFPSQAFILKDRIRGLIADPIIRSITTE